MSFYGRRCLLEIAKREKELAFWHRHARKLTRAERRRLARGDYSPIIRPVAPAWQANDTLEVARNLAVVVQQVRWRRDAYRTAFDIQDFRVRYPRRVPAMYEPPDLDEQGYPIAPTAQAIEDARLDGNYTAAGALAVPTAGDSVPDEFHNVLSMRARERRADYKRLERADETRKQELRAFTSAVKETATIMARHGLDTTELMVEMQRVLAEHQQRMKMAA